MLGTVKDLCVLAEGAEDIRISDSIERVDEESLSLESGDNFLSRSYVTAGMTELVTEGLKRLSGSAGSYSVFRLKQAMGGGKTHLIRTMAYLARHPSLREKYFPLLSSRYSFGVSRVCFFNGREQPNDFFWGRIASQLGKANFFESGPKAPGEEHWRALFEAASDPILILLDEMPTYFEYYRTQQIGQGTVADVAGRAFANLLSCVQSLNNVAVVVSELEASHLEGGSIINVALDNARKELNRVEFNITPVDLSGDETYAILKKRLFEKLPSNAEIESIAENFARATESAQRSKTIENQKTPEQIALEVTQTYPFHPQMKHIFALFKENKEFQQTRGLMELTSRLIKSVWARRTNDVLLIGPQHFDFSIDEVRDKIIAISKLDEALAKDIWASDGSSHAQIIDANNGNDAARQVSALLLLSSLSTAVNPVKGLTKSETLECVLSPNEDISFYQESLEQLQSTCWYLHRSETGKIYFDKIENLTKMLKGLADNAPEPKIQQLVAHRLGEMFEPKRKAAYQKVLALPRIEEITDAVRADRVLAIVDPGSKLPPEEISRLFESITKKNNLLILTGQPSFEMRKLWEAARSVYATRQAIAQNRVIKGTPQYEEFEELSKGYEINLTGVLKSLFDKLFYPYRRVSANEPSELREAKGLSSVGDTNDGEAQIEETLKRDPIKLYVDWDSESAFNAIRSRIEALIGDRESLPWSDVRDRANEDAAMYFLPPGNLEKIKAKAVNEGRWEDLGNGWITTKPKPKLATVAVSQIGEIRDDGTRLLEVQAVNSLPATTTIHYCEDGEVSKLSPKLVDEKLPTKAMRVSFLAVDDRPNGLESAAPYVWSNKLLIQHNVDSLGGSERQVTIYVKPGAEQVRYTLNGAEPRDGTLYEGPFIVGSSRSRLLVFAENQGIEASADFTIPEIVSNSKTGRSTSIDVPLTKAIVYPTSKQASINDRALVFSALDFAISRGVTFTYLETKVSEADRNARVQLSMPNVDAIKVKEIINLLSATLSPSATLILSLREMQFRTGQDLIDFAREMSLDLSEDNCWRVL